jgi:murein DD-endopeptidase MepM/ murein hydrolase activator NlpD
VEYLGAPIFAAATGDVVVARQGGYNGGYGNYVVIQHGNGTQTLYGHMQSVSVSPGDHVVQGQTIGYLGNTGRSTGPHLHFEVRGARNPF